MARTERTVQANTNTESGSGQEKSVRDSKPKLSTAEARREYQRRYYQMHKEKAKEYQRQYNLTHKKKLGEDAANPILLGVARGGPLDLQYRRHHALAGREDAARCWKRSSEANDCSRCKRLRSIQF